MVHNLRGKPRRASKVQPQADTVPDGITPAKPQATVDPNLKALVREDYVADVDSLATIAARHGVTVNQVCRWRSEDGWPPRRPSSTGSGPSSAAARKRRARADLELTGRLRELIRRALDQLEMTMTTSDPPATAGLERETRAIGTLIKNLEKVTKLETDWTRARDAARGGGPEPAPGLYDNDAAEQKRRALVERLERVRERYRRQSADRGPD